MTLVAPLVRNGSMGSEQFSRHVAELRADGRTVIHEPADAERLDALVENLAAQQRLARAVEAGVAIDAAEVNRLVLEREHLVAQRSGATRSTLVEGWILGPHAHAA